MGRRAPRVAFALLGALAALGPVAPGGAAAPTTMRLAGACQDGKGITVVVDASAFGDGVQVRCAPQPVRSGFEALTKAGFTYQGTSRFPGLLCRIDGEPADDPCQGAPPPDAYWAYWHAPRGGEWTYSTSGAGSRVPPPGSVEGWAFGDDAQPRIDPPAPPAPAPTTTRPPTVTTTLPAGGSAGPTSSPAGSSTTLPGDDEGATTSTTARDDRSTTTVADLAEDGEDQADDESDEQAGAAASAGSDRDGGSPLGAIVGLTAVAGLGAGALAVARRRRSAEGEPA